MIPAIIAPNHFSFLDHFFVAVYLRRKVHFMAKSQLFKPPLEVVFKNGGASAPYGPYTLRIERMP